MEELCVTNTAYLVLQNGKVFSGQRFGSDGDVSAELVFTTSMAGYLETLTDPGYHGQMVVQTFPLIGNYGVIQEDLESPCPRLSAYIVKKVCDSPSNFRSQGLLDDFLREQGIIGLKGIDTRALTKLIRDNGVMNAAIVTQLPPDLTVFAEMLRHQGLGADVYQVTCQKPYLLNEQGSKQVVIWDFGCKKSICEEIINRDCRVTIMPAGSSFEEILALNPDGILLSNGPGNPAVYTDIIAEIAKAMAHCQIPVFGIGLGHQLMALSQGAKSSKLPYGHRGDNQPVRDIQTGRLYITSQNHGYVIMADTLPAHAKQRFDNLNDGTCEGIEYLDMPAFSVQFNPLVYGGSIDTVALFDRFTDCMAD